MVKPKRRKFQIKQNKRKTKSRKTALNRNVKNQWVCITGRTLSLVNKKHGTDFHKEIIFMKKTFPNKKIEVLDEGCGFSSFADELNALGVKVTKTDLSPESFSSSINSLKTQRKISSDIKKLAVNHLKVLGRNRFHLVVSTFGGAAYTKDKRAALANIYFVLKPGGKAFLVAGKPIITEWRKQLEKLKIKYKSTELGIVLFKN